MHVASAINATVFSGPQDVCRFGYGKVIEQSVHDVPRRMSLQHS
jgi:hypothetical protein